MIPRFTPMRGFRPTDFQQKARNTVRDVLTHNLANPHSLVLLDLHSRFRNHPLEFLAVRPEEGNKSVFVVRFLPTNRVTVRPYCEWSVHGKALRNELKKRLGTSVVFGRQLSLGFKCWQDLISQKSWRELKNLGYQLGKKPHED